MANIPVNRQEVEQCLPHGSTMVLLEKVLQCTEDSLECETRTHLQSEHPLNVEGQLSIFAGVEYAAQAMALHNFLKDDGSGQVKKGFVAVTSHVQPHYTFLSQAVGVLNIVVNRVDATGAGSLYEFHISHGAEKLPVLQGKLLVMLSDQA